MKSNYLLQKFILFFFAGILFSGCIDSDNQTVKDNVDPHIELRKCPWCVYKDIRGGLAGGTIGSAAGPIGSMFGAVIGGFMDSYHEYTHLVGNDPDVDKLIQQLESIENRNIEVLDSQFDIVGKLHNDLFVNVLREHYVNNNPFENDEELIDYIIQIMNENNLFMDLTSEQNIELKDHLVEYSLGLEIPLSELENEFYLNITNTSFYKKSEAEMKAYIVSTKDVYHDSETIRSSLSIAYYTHYFWNEILKE